MLLRTRSCSTGPRSATHARWLTLGLGICLGLLPSGATTAGEVPSDAGRIREKGEAFPRKKLIQVGWDIPNTATLRMHGAAFDASTPFDGVIFFVEAKDDAGAVVSTQDGWSARPWKRSWFETARADLKACRFHRLRDNFLRINATPGNLDWSDDAGWAALAEKASICSWLCREAGARGPCIDFESYGAQQFRFDPERGRSFAETRSLARRRGAEFLSAIVREDPHSVVLAFWLLSISFKAGAHDDPEAILMGDAYGLLPAFIDGMLDALPSAATLVDGCENGYYLDGEAEYLRAAADMRAWIGPAARLLAPENRAKWRQQVQAGFGFYLDMYLNEEGNRYYFPPLDGSRLLRLERNLSAARAATDEYVWVYGEQCWWWPRPWGAGDPPENLRKTVGKGRPWEEALPGITRAVAWARDSASAAREEVEAARREGRLENWIRNGDFAAPSGAPPNLPAEWGVWQAEGSEGRFAWDAGVGEGSARAEGVQNGVFLQAIAAKAGEAYAVEARARAEGRTVATITVRWQKADGTWTRWDADQSFPFGREAEGKDAEGKDPGQAKSTWGKAFGVVRVPEGADKLVILLSASQGRDPSDKGWFDDVGVYRVR